MYALNESTLMCTYSTCTSTGALKYRYMYLRSRKGYRPARALCTHSTCTSTGALKYKFMYLHSTKYGYRPARAPPPPPPRPGPLAIKYYSKVSVCCFAT